MTARISGGSFLVEERKTGDVFTPEDFTEQHQLIAQTAEEFALNEIIPNIEKMEQRISPSAVSCCERLVNWG